MGDHAVMRRIVQVGSWTVAAVIWLFFLASQQFLPTESWLLDWHVYSAGARDFAARDLYHVALESRYQIPVAAFNYPPLSAIAVLPLLPLPDALAGNIWVIVNILAMAGTAVLTASTLGARQPWLWGGIGFLAYTIHPWMKLAFLGNNTPLVLLLVVAFAHQYLRGKSRTAGVLLGAAIAMKLWPLTLCVLLLRDRRWETLAWSSVVAGGVAAATVIWLGLDVVRPAWDAMQVQAIIEPDNPVLLVSWLRVSQAWWPWWGGFAVAIVILALPAHGRVGIGLGILAGLAPIPNLWRSYLPTLVVAVLFVMSGFFRWPLRRREHRPAVPAEQAPAAAPGDAGR